jgi:acyl-CoA thioester hydrolase
MAESPQAAYTRTIRRQHDLRYGTARRVPAPIGLVVETSCRYAAPLSYPDQVEIGLALDRLGTSSVVYRLGVFATGSGVAAAEGLFTHVYVGRRCRRPVPLPEECRERLSRLR